MLSGEISRDRTNEAVQTLVFDGLEDELKRHLERNLALLRDKRGTTTLDDEQMQLVEYIVEHPEALLATLQLHLRIDTVTLQLYAQEAGLELRKW